MEGGSGGGLNVRCLGKFCNELQLPMLVLLRWWRSSSGGRTGGAGGAWSVVLVTAENAWLNGIQWLWYWLGTQSAGGVRWWFSGGGSANGAGGTPVRWPGGSWKIIHLISGSWGGWILCWRWRWLVWRWSRYKVELPVMVMVVVVDQGYMEQQLIL